MFFILSKVLEFLIFPLTWVILLLGFTLIFWKRKFSKKLVWASLFILLLFSNTFIFNNVAGIWAIPHLHSDEIEHLDVGIVLGGMVTHDPKMDRVHFNGNADRILQTLPLLKQGNFDKVLISGGSGYIDYPEHKEAALIKDYLISIGFPTKNIWIESESRNTFQNATFSKALLDNKLTNDTLTIGLITSQLHMRRALACFNKQGLHCIPYSTNPITEEDKTYRLHEYFLPNIEVMQYWKSLLHEIVGYIVYDIKGYI